MQTEVVSLHRSSYSKVQKVTAKCRKPEQAAGERTRRGAMPAAVCLLNISRICSNAGLLAMQVSQRYVDEIAKRWSASVLPGNATWIASSSGHNYCEALKSIAGRPAPTRVSRHITKNRCCSMPTGILRGPSIRGACENAPLRYASATTAIDTFIPLGWIGS